MDIEKIKTLTELMVDNDLSEIVFREGEDRIMQPYIYVVDGNYANRGELYLAHKHTGVDLEIKFSVETLKCIQKLWRRPVHLQATINEEMVLFSFDGEQSQQQKIHDDLPQPANAVV